MNIYIKKKSSPKEQYVRIGVLSNSYSKQTEGSKVMDNQRLLAN